LKAGDIVVIEPGFPMGLEPVIDGVGVRLSESATSTKKTKSILHREPKNMPSSQLASDAFRAVGAIFTAHREPFWGRVVRLAYMADPGKIPAFRQHPWFENQPDIERTDVVRTIEPYHRAQVVGRIPRAKIDAVYLVIGLD
jgi:hypothetical protein